MAEEVLRYSNLAIHFERVWDTSLDVVWAKELYDGFDITKLHVHIVAPQLKVERYFSPSDSRISLSNLSSGSRVIASVRAQHSDGIWGNWCRAECTTVLPPTLRVRRIGRSSIEGVVHWSPAGDAADSNTPAASPSLSHHDVMLVPGGRGVARFIRVPAGAPAFRIIGLPPSCSFAVRARAVSAAGDTTSFGPVAIFRTVPPLLLGVADLAATSATITWTRALDHAASGADAVDPLSADALEAPPVTPDEAQRVADAVAAEPLAADTVAAMNTPHARAHALRWLHIRVFGLPAVQRGEDGTPSLIAERWLGDPAAAALAQDPAADVRSVCADVAEAVAAGTATAVADTELQVGGLESGREYEVVCRYQTAAGGAVEEGRVRLTTISGAGLVDVTMVTSETVDIAWRHPTADPATGALVKGGDRGGARVAEWQLVVFRGVSVEHGEVLLASVFPYETMSTRVQALHPATEYGFTVRPRTSEGVWGPYAPARWVTTRPPLRCRAVAAGETWLLVGWRSAPPARPAGSPAEEAVTDGVERWHMQLTEVRGLHRESKYLDGAAESYRAVGLLPGRTYEATVQAFWQGQWQPWSESVELSTHAAPAVWAACRTEESVTVEWRSAYSEDPLNEAARASCKVRVVVTARGVADRGRGAMETLLLDEEGPVRGTKRISGLTAGQAVMVRVSDFDVHLGAWNAASRPVVLRALPQVLEVASLTATTATVSWVRDADILDVTDNDGAAAAIAAAAGWPRVALPATDFLGESDADAHLRGTLAATLTNISGGAARWAETSAGEATGHVPAGVLLAGGGPRPPRRSVVVKTCLKVVTAEGVEVGSYHFLREDPTLFTVSGLAPGAHYVARLATLDDAGVWSPWSAAVRFMTAPRLAIDVADVGPTHAVIQWRLSVPVAAESARLYEAGLTGPVTITYDEIVDAATGAPVPRAVAAALAGDVVAMRSVLGGDTAGGAGATRVAGTAVRRGARVSFTADASAAQHVAWGLEPSSAYVVTISPGRAAVGATASEPACVATAAAEVGDPVDDDAWRTAAHMRVAEATTEHVRLAWRARDDAAVDDWLLRVEALGGDPDTTATVVGKGVTEYLLRGLAIGTVYSAAVVPARRGAADGVTELDLDVAADDSLWLAVASVPAECVGRAPSWLHVGWRTPTDIVVSQRFVFVTLMGNGAAHTQVVRHAGDVESHVFAGLRAATEYRVHVLVLAVCPTRAEAERFAALSRTPMEPELARLPPSYWPFNATFGLTSASTGSLAARSLSVTTLEPLTLTEVAVADTFAVVEVGGRGAPSVAGIELSVIRVGADGDAAADALSGPGAMRWRCAGAGRVLLDGLDGGRRYHVGVRVLAGVPALDEVADWGTHPALVLDLPAPPDVLVGGGQSVDVPGSGPVAVGAGEAFVVAAWHAAAASSSSDAAPPRWEVWLSPRSVCPPADVPAAVVAAAGGHGDSELLVHDVWATVRRPCVEMGGLDPQRKYYLYVRCVRTMVVDEAAGPVEITGAWGSCVSFHTQAPLRAALRGVADNHAVVGWVRAPPAVQDGDAASGAAAVAAQSGLPLACRVRVYALPPPAGGASVSLPAGGCAWRVDAPPAAPSRPGTIFRTGARGVAAAPQPADSFDWRTVGLRGEPDFVGGVVVPYGGGAAERLRLVHESETAAGEVSATVPDLLPGETYVVSVQGRDLNSWLRPCPAVIFTTVPALRLAVATVADTFAVVQWVRGGAAVGPKVAFAAAPPTGAVRDFVFLADASAAATTVEVGVTAVPSRFPDPHAADGRGPLCSDCGVERSVVVAVDPVADGTHDPQAAGAEAASVGYRIGGLPAGCPLLLRVRSRLPLSDAWGVWSNTVAVVTQPTAAVKVQVVGDTFAGVVIAEEASRIPASAAELCAGLYMPRADAVTDAIAGLLYEAAAAVGATDPPSTPPDGFGPGAGVYSQIAAASAAWLPAESLVPTDVDIAMAAIGAFADTLRARADHDSATNVADVAPTTAADLMEDVDDDVDDAAGGPIVASAEQIVILRRDEAYARALLRHCALVREAVARVAHLNTIAKALPTARTSAPAEAAVVAWDIALVNVDKLRAPRAVASDRPTTAPAGRVVPDVEFRAVVRVGGGAMRVEGLAPRAPLAALCRPLFVANFPERVIEPALVGGQAVVPRGALASVFAGLPEGGNPFGPPPMETVEPALVADADFPSEELADATLPLPLAWGGWGRETALVTLAKAELRVVGVGGDFVVLDWLSDLPDATVEGVMRSVERFALRAFNRSAAASGEDGVHAAAQTFWVSGSSVRSGPGESRAVLVPGLVPDSTYVLYLCAQFMDGTYGDWSSPIIVHTDLQVLCALRNVAETAASLVLLRPGGDVATEMASADGPIATVDVPAPYGDFDAARADLGSGPPEEVVHAAAVVSLDELASSLPSACAAQPASPAGGEHGGWAGTFDIVSARSARDTAEALVLPRGEVPPDGPRLPPLRRPARDSGADSVTLHMVNGACRFEVALSKGIAADIVDIAPNSALTLWLRHPAPAHVTPVGDASGSAAQAGANGTTWLPWHAVATFETVASPPGKPAVTERHGAVRGTSTLSLQWAAPADGLGRATGIIYQVEQAIVYPGADEPAGGRKDPKAKPKGGPAAEARGGRAGELATLAQEKHLSWRAVAVTERPGVRVDVPESALKCYFRVRCGKVHMRVDAPTQAVLSNVDDELGGVGYARGQVVLASKLASNAPIVWSRWSPAGQIRTPEAPSSPLGLRVVQLGATAAKIRWLPPANAASHGPLLYKVYIGVYEAVDSWVLAGATVGTSWVFPALQPLSHYRTAVTVESTMGVSTRNNVLHFSTRPITQAEYVRPINSTVAHRPALNLNLRASEPVRESRRDAPAEPEGVQWLRRQSLAAPNLSAIASQARGALVEDGAATSPILPGAVGGALALTSGVADISGAAAPGGKRRNSSPSNRPLAVRYEHGDRPVGATGRSVRQNKVLPHLDAAARSVVPRPTLSPTHTSPLSSSLPNPPPQCVRGPRAADQ